MNIQGLIGKKLDQSQGFLEDGTRVPVSYILVSENVVTQIKSRDHEGYNSLQLGFGITKRSTKSVAGHFKKAGTQKTPRFLREIRIDDVDDATLGDEIKAEDVFKPGDIIDVSGTSKGKGYAGVVKRHHFKGGPRTHGQSDRERAPGSIGQTTTPGRVYKGKRMAGRMGGKRATVKNLEVLDVTQDTLLIKGLVPGPRGSIVLIKKRSKNKQSFISDKQSFSSNKKFIPLFRRQEEGKEKSSQTQKEVAK